MGQCARPQVADDEVLVRVKASAVAPIDGSVRRGDFAQFVQLPTVPGYAVSGVIEKLGMEVDRFKVGDEVIGSCVRACVRARACVCVDVDGELHGTVR
jgi:NADPH:quinone reductase-like Zn-dependent oxidoreductase